MPSRLMLPLMMVMGLWTSLVVAGDSTPVPCLMRPPQPQIHLPRQGFVRLEGKGISGECVDVPAQKWIRQSSGSLDLLVYADGPSGSGRYWNVTIGVAPKQHSGASRGVCLETSTVGWRTLQRFKNTPLAWLDDLDQDGKAELIVWSSFPLREDASEAEYGLVAWVYRPASEDSLVIDWGLSRRMARDLAGAYEAPFDSTTPSLGRLRTGAAAALKRFADERCGLSRPDVR